MPIGRRDFITTAAAAGSAHLLGASQARAAVNDRIRVAVIGLGGRGRDHMMAKSFRRSWPLMPVL